MARAFICDHCGKVFKNENETESPIVVANNKKPSKEFSYYKYDLCAECTKEIENFLHYQSENKEKEKNNENHD